MQLQFKNYVNQQQNTVASTLTDFIKEGATQGFNLMQPKGTKSPVHLSKAGNPQMVFIDKEGNRVYLRISTNLDAALTAGEKINLLESPVYHTDLTQLPNGGTGSMLVLGMKADAQEFIPVDPKTAFAGGYTRPEPATP
jgi:hypothetical protein